MLKALCLNNIVHPGLDPEKYTKRTEDGQPIVKPESIPLLQESGWTIEDYHELRKQKERTFMISCQ